ncbi:putative serine/threonine-protein kinase receptor [Niemeyer virus]|nr:putative serine/threonine-protein kinase receptor [Niemeyer virus]
MRFSNSQMVFCIVMIISCLNIVESNMGSRIYCSGSLSSVELFSQYINNYALSNDDVTIIYAGMLVDDINADVYIADCSAYDRAIPQIYMVSYGLIQFPIVGQAIVIIYNVPGLSNHNMIIDRETLGKIWTGDIRKWNDIEIQNLNPDIASQLPNETITLGYNDAYYLSISEIMQLALRNFSEEFANAHTIAGGKFGNMIPAQQGYAIDAGEASESRIDWVKNTPFSLSFADFATVYPRNVSYMHMYNKAGKLVEPNITTVQSAMADFKEIYTAGDFTIDIFDAPGENSWPISWVNYISMTSTFQQADCIRTKELLDFIAWFYMNNEIAEIIKEYQYYPLDNTIKKIAIDNMYNVTCNGKVSQEHQYLIAFGSPLSIMASWPNTWASSMTTVKYYASLSDQAIELQKTFSGDFGITIKDFDKDKYPSSTMEDIGVSHLAAFNIVPAYNIPEFVGLNETLVLNYETIVDIYLGLVTNWNDSSIRNSNNPYINSLLPNKTITVVVQKVESDINELFTSFLSSKSGKFNNVIGSTNLPKFDFVSNNVVYTEDVYGVGNTLVSTDYSFAFWPEPGIRLLSHMAIVQAASIQTSTGTIIKPTNESLSKAVSDKIDSTNRRDIEDGSWPFIAMMSLVYHQKTMQSFSKASALADFIYWTQIDETAASIADTQGYYVASSHPKILRENLELLQSFTFEDRTVSKVANCIFEGTICYDKGTCNNNVCLCNIDREGQFCELEKTQSDTNIVTIILAVVIPISFIIVCIICILVVALIFSLRFRKGISDDWEIDFHELELGEQLGTGAFGEVHKGIWRGTEVAVKMISSDKIITKDIERSFKDEVRVMTTLRHPNVVLFMAASTKPPKMCIVMEFMALGSLHDLLKNELIPDIPFALKVKIAYQASKGMHFLHSSGITHRDLKSLNLLLDIKWNVKVSDFGLTKFKSDVKSINPEKFAGTIQWTAPEILSEDRQVDYILSDVYSFGIIMWELITRDQPYFGMSPAAIAVSVIRDNFRPLISDQLRSEVAPEYIELLTNCWHFDPTIRPTFLEIMTRLSNLMGDSGMTGMSSSSSNSSKFDYNSFGKVQQFAINRSDGIIQDSYNKTDSYDLGSNNSRSSMTSDTNKSNKYLRQINIQHPTGEVVVVFTDVISAAQLWEYNAPEMKNATILYNKLVRSICNEYGGYESLISKERNSGEGSFCLIFSNAQNAIIFCEELQKQLVSVNWSPKLLEHPITAVEKDINGTIIYAGLRVRIGLHFGSVKINYDPISRKYEYFGPTVNTAAAVTTITHGGQIIMTEDVTNKLSTENSNKPICLGRVDIDGIPDSLVLYEHVISALIGRFFGGVTRKNASFVSNETSTDYDDMDTDDSTFSARVPHQAYQYHAAIENNERYLTSAGLCSWVINYDEIKLGEQIGLGSYGVVYRGKWKNVDVAIKKFIKQKIDENNLLDIREEIAFLKKLHHPNIITMVGASLKKPNICIVTEYMEKGNLRDAMRTCNPKLEWNQKIKILVNIAKGISYLHSFNPPIIHRDIKPSNILIDENWNVKIADFGFARIKEENAIMTRCGTPCWTAPEIIRNEIYDEKVDVFSFGIVMWEVLTCKEPFIGSNFMKITMDILEDVRPVVPRDCPEEFAELMKKCWHAKSSKRPTMDDIIIVLAKFCPDITV